jgi:hypothetical protein
MKWFFCWCQETEFRTDHGWADLIRVAVRSALQHPDLEPHFIYDGEPSDLTAELEHAGVKIHYHRLSFIDVLTAHSSDPSYQAVARGAFLRFDIPLFAGSDDFVLYTDADVIFGERIDFRGYQPEFLAAAPQFDRGTIRDMNSGVMVMNVAGWRARRDDLLNFTALNMHLGLDQEVLREFVGLDYLLLPDRFNWKPYWGANQDAAILHWHGPKPETAARWLADPGLVTHDGWMPLLERGRDGYAWYVAQHQTMLSAWRERPPMDRVEVAARTAGLPWPLPPIGMEDFEWTNFEHPLKEDFLKNIT